MTKPVKSTLRKELRPEQEIGWRVVEKVAALLEKSLTPLAKVEHNVFLPVIGKSRKRQCDVVITYGERPRQTVAIVEVQKRDRKPDINTFHGWCHKMQEVGAQHLICVSIRGYPKSIIDEVATRYGPTVKLLTLSELKEAKLPGLDFISPFLFHNRHHFTLESAGPGVKVENHPTDQNLTLGSDSKVFTLDDSNEMQSLDELIDHALGREISSLLFKQGAKTLNSYSVEITLGSMERNLWLHINGRSHKVLSLPVRLRVETRVSSIPLSILTYQQQSIEGALAWVTLAKGVVEGEEVSIQVVFMPNKDGFLRCTTIKQQGVESVGLIFSPNKAVMEAYIAANLYPVE